MDETNESVAMEVDEDTQPISSNLAQKLYRLLARGSYLQRKVGHSTQPDLNTSKYWPPKESIEKNEYRTSLPTPVFTSTTGLLETDPCYKRVNNYRNYINQIKYIPSAYKRCEASKLYRNARKRGIYSYNIIRFAELLEQHPDRYFNGRYDWFYTGGNLTSFDYGDDKYVVHATGNQLQELNILKAESSRYHNKLTHMLHKSTTKLVKGNKNPEILEIQTLNDSHVSVRRRNYVSLYEFEDDALKYRFHLYSSSIPFISSTKASKNSSDSILTSDLNHTVALWDLNLSTKKSKQLLLSLNAQEETSNWNSVCYISNNSYGFVKWDTFYMLDSRQSAQANAKLFSTRISSGDCEINTMITPSCFNDLVYIASTHKLMAIDKRFLGKNITDDRYIALRWNHQMDGYPLMLRTKKWDGVEIILLSSYNNGDVRVCENSKICLDTPTGSQYEYWSAKLPMRPPNIRDAYKKARLQGLCLSPSTYIMNRLNYCHTGICFLDNIDDNLGFLMANSNGDIFSQRLIDRCDEELFNEDNVAAMKQWDDKLLQIDLNRNDPISVTSVCNLKSLRKVIRCEKLDTSHKFERDTSPNDFKSSKKSRGKWRRSIKELGNYKDALAIDILSVWDTEPVDEEKTNASLILPSQDDGDKTLGNVSEWLERSKVPEMDESLLGIGGLDSSILDETVANSTLTEPSKKIIKQSSRRTYVKGF